MSQFKKFVVALFVCVPWVAVFALALALCKGCSSTYSAKPLRWQSGEHAGLPRRVCALPVQIETDPTVPWLSSIVDQAMADWNVTLGYEAFTYTPHAVRVYVTTVEDLPTRTEYTMHNELRIFRTVGQARSDPRFVLPGGCAMEGTLVIAAGLHEGRTRLQIQALIMHELGHYLGLDHNPYSGYLMHSGEHVDVVDTLPALDPAELRLIKDAYASAPALEAVQ